MTQCPLILSVTHLNSEEHFFCSISNTPSVTSIGLFSKNGLVKVSLMHESSFCVWAMSHEKQSFRTSHMDRMTFILGHSLCEPLLVFILLFKINYASCIDFLITFYCELLLQSYMVNHIALKKLKLWPVLWLFIVLSESLFCLNSSLKLLVMTIRSKFKKL